MAADKLKNIFLSASIPLPERDHIYYNTADIIAIRDSVIALASIVLPSYRLIWGGHPSITPLICSVLQKLNMDIRAHMTLYQSKFFEENFPKDNNAFHNVIFTEAKENKDDSLELMRTKMLSSREFSAGVFIGGMEGVEIEYKMFRENNPQALILPIASTGAAAKCIYDNFFQDENERLEKDYAYTSLFQTFLIDKIYG